MSSKFYRALTAALTVAALALCSCVTGSACSSPSPDAGAPESVATSAHFGAIGPITPGSRVTVTPDTNPPNYASLTGPSPTMPIIAQDILDIELALMNVKKRAVDGYSGGTYSPSSPIAIQGDAGVQFNAPLNMVVGELTIHPDSALTMKGVTWFGTGGGATPYVNSDPATHWNGTFRIGRDTTSEVDIESGSALAIASGGSLVATSGSTVSSASGCDWSGTFAFDSTSHITESGTLTLSGSAARLRTRTIWGALSGTTNYGMNDADVIAIKTPTGSSVEYDLVTTGAVEGDVMRFILAHPVDLDSGAKTVEIHGLFNGAEYRVLSYTGFHWLEVRALKLNGTDLYWWATAMGRSQT